MANDGKRDYAVGYGKPPRQTQFKKGQSGNPNGRARGSKNLATLIMAALNEIHPAPSGPLLAENVKDRLAEINFELRTTAATIGPNALIGSTVVVLLFLENQSCCLWAGDSRFYRMRAGRLLQLSRDQSHVQNLIDRGEIAPEAAATHPLGNIVTNLLPTF